MKNSEIFKSMTNKSAEEVKRIMTAPCAFEIRRGKITFIGNIPFNELVNDGQLQDQHNLHVENRAANGRFCKPFLATCYNDEVADNLKGVYGTINIDGSYMSYCVDTFVDVIDYFEDEMKAMLNNRSDIDYDYVGMVDVFETLGLIDEEEEA